MDEKEILLQKFADANRRLMLAQEQLAIANKKLKQKEQVCHFLSRIVILRFLSFWKNTAFFRFPGLRLSGFANTATGVKI